jgi:Cu-processing system permease protein
MNWLTIARREMKLGFRNPWAYAFLALFAAFALAVLLIQSQSRISAYTHTTGALINLILYLLPLMTLLLGSFSMTAEKEDGGWHLLATYPLSSRSLLLGKYAGVAVVLAAIVCFGYGITGVVAALFGQALSIGTLLFFLLFSLLLIFLFLGLSILLGAVSRNRWQALTYGVAVWFVLILGWPTLLVAVLGWLPYTSIKPVLIVLSLLNPAELTRIFMITRLGGGSIFGPEYYQWIRWVIEWKGSLAFVLVGLSWIAATLFGAVRCWERGRYRG